MRLFTEKKPFLLVGFGLFLSLFFFTGISKTHSQELRGERGRSENSFQDSSKGPRVEVERVAGFRVVWINDFGPSNEVAIAVKSPSGKQHDSQAHAGKAHLWEHVIHRSNQTFPDARAQLELIAQRSGGSRNAATYPDHTVYYHTFHPDAAAEVVSFFGSMITKPRFDQYHLDRERETVINEANELRNRDSRILSEIGRHELLADHHPFKKYTVGTEEGLRKIKLSDLRKHHQRHFNPKLLTIYMAGVPDESKDKYRALFKKNFDATNHQHSEIQSNVKIEFPSMLKDVPRDQRIIEVGSKGEFRGILLDFEVEPSWLRNHVYDFELFRYLISHPNEGSLQWFLRKEDLSEKLSLSAYKVNNRAYIGLAIIPTEHGLKHYKELIKKVFHFISSIRERGIEQEVLNRLSIEAAIRTQNKNRKALSVINDLKQKAGLGLPESSATLAPTRYDQVNTESIRSFVENAFPVDKLLVTAMGPRFRSHEQVHPVFDRHFKVIRSAEPLKSWEVALNTPIGYDPNRIQVLKGELLPLPKKSLGRLNAKIVQREGGEIWLTQKTASKSKRVLAVQTKPIDTALEERVALDLLSVALRNERSNQLSEISLSSNVKVMKSISYGFYLLFNGEQGANIDILNRFLELFFGYKPSEEAFEKAKKFLKNKIKKEGGGFSAFLALNRAMSFIDHEPATPKRRLSILEALTLDRVLQLRGQAFKNATTSILVDSPSGRELLKEVSQTIKTYIPSTLSQKKLEYFQESFPQIETKERIFFEFSKEKSQDALGIARVYQGPDLTQENQRDYLAWSLFRSSLKDAIFGLNRTEKGLGYVQGATLAPAQSKTRVALYGMADNPNQWDEIEKGWDKILGNIEDYVTRESLENARVGMLRSLSLLPSSPEKAVFEKIQHAQKYGNPNFQEEQIKVLSKLTPKEIIERAIKYLKGPSWTVIGSRDRSMVERRLRLDSKDMKTERSFLTREGLFKNSQKPKQRPVQKISGRCRGSFL